MNSPDSPLFHKRENLYGQYESRQEIRKLDFVVLCEGQTDVISAHQSGVHNIVAPLGTGLTIEQIEKLSHLTKNFLFFFDSDHAGQEALVRAFKLASQLDVYPFAASPAPYKDIDEMLQKDKAMFNQLIENKQSAFSVILSRFIADKDLNKLEDTTQTQQYIEDLLKTVTNPSLKDYYLKKAYSLTKLSYNGETNTYHNLKNADIQAKNVRVKSAGNNTEKTYIKLLLSTLTIHTQYLLPPEYIVTPEIQDLLKYISGKQEMTRAQLYEQFHEDPTYSSLLEEIIFEISKLPEEESEVEKQLLSITNRLKKEYFTRQQKSLSVKIAVAEESGNTQESERLLNEMLDLNKLLKELEND
jgi:DNA primase